MAPRRDADTIRILVATDSHVGFAENDPIRKDDSWRSFDEAMQIAKNEDVDMILLAGDLYHENKPSRKAQYQVMRSLRMNCLGDKPCELEFLSDAGEIFDGAFADINYEDPNINVAIPVFSIHGNHDDPTGDGLFCSLDLLQVTGLLNYIGRQVESDKIDVRPALLQKGNTKLALYGLSNIRDERLYRTWRANGVTFYAPSRQRTDWFNLFALHQNHHAYNESGYIPEDFIPNYMDLVVWGHEHECLIEPRLNPESMFHVMQPGSSIATSLVPTEAVPKHVAVVEITGKEFKMTKHRLKTVRPFITREITLATDAHFKKLAKTNENRTQITAGLIKIVDEMIDEAKTEWIELQGGQAAHFEPGDIPRPLVRLKVEASPPEDGGKFETENPQRFSNRFADKVANTNDVVHFYRKKPTNRTKKIDTEMPDEAVLASMATIDNVKVEQYVREFLTNTSLQILPKNIFGDAVHEFVEKDDKSAMENFVKDSLKDTVKEMLDRDAEDEGDMEAIMDAYREKLDAAFEASGGVVQRSNRRRGKLLPRRHGWDSDLDGEWDDPAHASHYGPSSDSESIAPARRANRTAASDDDASVVSAPAAKTTRKAPAKKASTKAKASTKVPTKAKVPAKAPAKTNTRSTKKKVAEPSDDEDEDDFDMIDAPPQPKSQPKRAAATKGRQTTLNFSQSQAKPSTARELSYDEISDDDAFEPVVSSSRRK